MTTPFKEVPSEFYDADVSSKPLQQHIDEYYTLQNSAAKRRIGILMKYLDIQPGEQLLDIGCGVGTFAYHSAVKGATSYGIDYSQDSIKIAQQLTKQFGVGERTHFFVGKIDALPFEDSKFDKIIAADIIEHISDTEKERMLKEMARVLKKDGLIIVFTPNAIRDAIGLFLKKITFREIQGWNVKAHFGLISRRTYNKILRRNNVDFSFHYIDLTRPYLASIPFVREYLSLNMLWVIKKGKSAI